MKHLLPLLLCILYSFLTTAQPDSFKYQAVARDGNNQLLATKNISLRFSIIQDNAPQSVRYVETHTTTTSDLGIFHVNIGNGNPIQGQFSTIAWGSDDFKMKIEVDYNGGSNYIDMGTIPFLSVPYALHARTVDDKNDADADPANEIQTLSKNGNTITLSKNGGSFTDEVNDADADPNNEIQSISKSGNTVTLSRNGGSFTDQVDDADASPTNEIQTLSINGTQLTISGGNSVNLPTGSGGGTSDDDPNNEIQSLSSTKNGNTVNLNISLGGQSTSFDVSDADNSPSNEIQTISKNGSTVSLSNNGGSFTDETNDADANPSNEIQSLSLNGSTLSISQGNSINLSSLQGQSPWVSDGNDKIKYTGESVKIENINNSQNYTAIESSKISMINSTNSVSIDPSELNFGNTSRLSGSKLSFIDPQTLNSGLMVPGNVTLLEDNIYATLRPNYGLNFHPFDAQDTRYSNLNLDSLTFSQPNAGLLLPQHSNLTSFGLFFDNSIETAVYSNYGIQLHGSPFSTDIGSNFFEMHEKVGNVDISRIRIEPDSLTLLTDSGWKTSQLGTGPNSSGRLSLFSGGAMDEIINIGENIFGNPNINIFDNGFTRAYMETSNGAGEVGTFGSNGSTNTYMGPSFIDSEQGEMTVNNAQGNRVAGMNGGNGGLGEVYTMGEMHILDSNNNPSAEMNQFGFEVYDPSGISAVTISRDLFDPSVGNVVTFGENHSYNFSAGAAYNAGGLNTGFAGVYDSNSELKAGMEVNLFNQGRLFSKGYIDVTDANDNTVTQINEKEVKLIDPSNGNTVAVLGKYAGSSNVGELRLNDYGNNLNVYVGPNFRTNDQRAGLIGIANNAGNITGGIEVQTSGASNIFGNILSIHNGSDQAYIKAQTNPYFDGTITTFNFDGNITSEVGNAVNNPGTGRFGVYDKFGEFKGELSVSEFTGRGQVKTQDVIVETVTALGMNTLGLTVSGPNSANVYLDGFSNNSDFGSVAVFDDNGQSQAGIYVNPATRQGVVWGDIKNFRMDHPLDKSKEIVYASLEGPEAAAYTRGTSSLRDGKVFVEFPEHYQLVANAETMTIQLTPLYANTIGLAVTEKTDKGFWVQERMDGKGNFDFDWHVTCVRKGYEDFEVVRPNQRQRISKPVDQEK